MVHPQARERLSLTALPAVLGQSGHTKTSDKDLKSNPAENPTENGKSSVSAETSEQDAVDALKNDMGKATGAGPDFISESGASGTDQQAKKKKWT